MRSKPPEMVESRKKCLGLNVWKSWGISVPLLEEKINLDAHGACVTVCPQTGHSSTLTAHADEASALNHSSGFTRHK